MLGLRAEGHRRSSLLDLRRAASGARAGCVSASESERQVRAMTADIPPPVIPCECAPAVVETPTARLARLRAEVRRAELDVLSEKINTHRRLKR